MPDLLTTVTPESLRKSMPDQLIGQRHAMLHFYNKFKTKAKELAPTGNCSYELEISTSECGVRSDFDVEQLQEDLRDKLIQEGFRHISSSKYDEASETCYLTMAWKEEPRLSKSRQLQLRQDEAALPPLGAYQMNEQNLAKMAEFYRTMSGYAPYPNPGFAPTSYDNRQ